MRRLDARGVSAAFEPRTGQLPSLRISGVEVRHGAPWRNPDPCAALPDGVSRAEMLLAGDFFCAPFGRDDVGGDPLHGWPACSGWTDPGGDGALARFVLARDVRGARIGREIWLRDDHPAVYQRHAIEGGQGRLSYAHHPMVRIAAGGRLAFSPKRAVLTDAAQQHDAAHALWALDQCRADFPLSGWTSPCTTFVTTRRRTRWGSSRSASRRRARASAGPRCCARPSAISSWSSTMPGRRR